MSVNLLVSCISITNLKLFWSTNLLEVKIFFWYAPCFFILCFPEDTKIPRASKILPIFIREHTCTQRKKQENGQNRALILWLRYCQASVCWMWWPVWNSVLWAVCTTPVLTLGSMSSPQFRERNRSHSEMKGSYFPICCLYVLLFQQSTSLKCCWGCNRSYSFQTPCNFHTFLVVIVPVLAVNL